METFEERFARLQREWEEHDNELTARIERWEREERAARSSCAVDDCYGRNGRGNHNGHRAAESSRLAQTQMRLAEEGSRMAAFGW